MDECTAEPADSRHMGESSLHMGYVWLAFLYVSFLYVFNFKYLPKCKHQHNSRKNPDFSLHLKLGHYGNTVSLSYKAATDEG